jgi:hypothetical protein
MATLKTCVICGRGFWAKWRTLTCSTDCRREQIRERKRLFRAAHREEIKEKDRIYRETHREEIRRKDRLYRRADPKLFSRRHHAYQERNREKLRARDRERKQLQRLAYAVLKQFPGVLPTTTTQPEKNDE